MYVFSCIGSADGVSVGFLIVSVAFIATPRRAKATVTCELIAVDPMKVGCRVAAGLVRVFFRQGHTLVRQQKSSDWRWKASGPDIEWAVTIPVVNKSLAKCFCVEAKAMYNDSLLLTDPKPYSSKSSRKAYTWRSGGGANQEQARGAGGSNQEQGRRSARNRLNA
jgi:hypothetical protein